MKEEDLVRAMLSARVKYYRTITYVLLCLVSVCVLALAGTIYFPTHSEKEVTTLFISLTSGLFGSLLTIVTQGIQAARRLRSDDELQQLAEEFESRKALRMSTLKEEVKHEQQAKEKKE
jgi:TRAP-type C4-dicarboxylate transport system permease small subunit